MKKLSIIYPYYNTPKELTESLLSLQKAVGNLSYEIIIIDNASSLPVPSEIKNNPKVTYIKNNKNVGYGAAINQGVRLSKAEYVLCTNPDIIFKKNSLYLLYKKINSDKKIGVIGPKLTDKNGNILKTASRLPLFPINIVLFTFLRKLPFFSKYSKRFHYNEDFSKTFSADVLGGACLLFQKSVFEKVGGFDERFFLYFEESDICKRISECGYDNVYFPVSGAMHYVGRSLQEKNRIKNFFQRSRFLFVKKHQNTLIAFLSEGVIRSLSLSTILLIVITSLSLYINFYKISTLMMFQGDFARDMIVARDMVQTGSIPLLGIPSSVVWLHQGPLSIYLIGLSYLIGGFSPWIPTMFYGILGALTAISVYVLGRELTNKYVGLMGAIFFVSSPLVIINSRIPYHTAPIPFFAALFYLTTYRYIQNRSRKMLFLVAFLFGLLFQLELSNGILFVTLLLLAIIYKLTFQLRDYVVFLVGVLIGIFPLVVHDVSHKFIQTLGFIAWVLNRIRLFFGLTFEGDSTTAGAPQAFITVWDQMVRFIFPGSSNVTLMIVSAGTVLSILIVLPLLFKKHHTATVISSGIFIPIVGFIIHARPGMAYFPVLFPLLSICIAVFFYTLMKRIRMIGLLFLLLCIVNITYVFKNLFFLDIGNSKGAFIADWEYGLGPSLEEQIQAISFIQTDSKGKAVFLMPGGFLGDFRTGIDNYKYLAWWKGIQQSEDGIQYTFFQNFSELPENARVEYMSDNIAVVKNE